jgi:hypothetical protein
MRKSPLTLLVVGIAAVALTACGNGGDDKDASKPHDDDGIIPNQILPPPSEDSGEIVGMDEVLPTVAKPESGWLSAPWALASQADKAATEIQIVYVDGDTRCYGHAGFTLDESNSKVTVGSYTAKDPDGADCPSNPAGAFKWGTVKLAEPLGDRTLVHVGVDSLYSGFSWVQHAGSPASAPPVEPESETESDPAPEESAEESE